MTYVRDQQANLSNSLKPATICSGYPNLTQAQALADAALGSKALGLLGCYCTNDITRIFSDSNCSYLKSKYLTGTSLPFLIVVAVILINYALQLLFQFLSAFERHKSASAESVSKIIKIFVAQAFNTGALILIVNIKFYPNKLDMIFTGSYDDVSPTWFTDVAVTLLITMLINVINLPLVTFAEVLFQKLLQCCDRGCRKDRNRTKKKTQKEWEELYLGPEFLMDFRYAQILTIIFVCLLYGAPIPLLFVSTFATLFVFYVMDKYCLLKVYRLPKRYNEQIQKMVINCLFFAIVLHCGMAIWTYGNIKVFGDAVTLSLASGILEAIKNSSSPGIFQNLVSRAFQNQNLSLGIIFVLTVVAMVLNLLFKNSIHKIFSLCRRRISKTVVNGAKKEAYTGGYFTRIKSHDIRSEMKWIQKELIITKNDQLRALLTQRLDRLQNELNNRLEEDSSKSAKSVTKSKAKEINDDKFQGIFSYHISHNPEYKKFFEVKGLEESFSPSPIN